MTPAVRMSGVTKRFGAFTALDSVDLEVAPGTVHAIVGENGAGKTTLMRVLYGAVKPDGGAIEVDGAARHWRNSAEAIAHGIGMVSQHYSIIPELTCLQNLVLGAEPAFLLPLDSMKARAGALAEQMGFSFDWDAEASTLSPASAQKLEILKLLWRESQTMVLDEPTAMLSPTDSEALYASLKSLAAQGATVIVVTHRIPEVLQHCSRVTVLRGGKKVADRDVAQTDATELAELIVGHSLVSAEFESTALGEPVLDVSGLVVRGSRREEALRGASLTVCSGEIVGLAGVDGNGQRELIQALAGVLRIESGTIVLDRVDATRLSARARARAGMRLIPEDRHEEGVVEDWSLTDNAALGLQRLEPLARGPWSDLGERTALAERIAERFRTKHAGLRSPMRSLSGGNQQRFVAARALELGPRLVLAFQPTRGLDIDGTAQLYAAIRGLCREGAGALVVSFDLDELLENCDRTLVIREGRIYEPERQDRLEIGRLMVGAR